MGHNKIILNLEKTRISNIEYYIVQNVNLPKETSTKRVADGWINISQCFKLETTYSNQSKRQRVIEEEEKSGNIKVEKIIGGWGRIQGSWVSSKDAIYLFKKYSFKNFVNLTILTFKEKEDEPLPVKQDVKNYQAIQFEFDAVDEVSPNSSKKENKTPKSQKLKNVSKSSQEVKNKNGYKRVSLNQISSANYDATGYTTKNNSGILGTLDNNVVKNEESPLKIRSDNESNIASESPYKKIKIENAKDQFFSFDTHRAAFPVMQSAGTNRQPNHSYHNLTATPYNSQPGTGQHELSTFKNYSKSNSFQFGSDVKNNGSVIKNVENPSQYNHESTSSINSPLNNKVHHPKIIPVVSSAPPVKKPRMNGEKFKNLIIKALETENENDDIVTILHATKFPKNLDPNFQVDEEGNTALHWAAAQGNVSLVKYLVEVLKSDPFKSNLKGMNCISKSLFFDNNYKNDSFQTILTLLSNCLIIQDVSGKLPLHYIADLCSLKVKDINVSIYYLNWILKFLSIEVDVPMKKTDGSNEIVMTRQDFLKNGLNYQDSDGNTPLHILAVNGNVQLYNHFISLGAVPTVLNLKGETPHMIMSKVYGEMNKNLTLKLKDAVSLGSGTLNSDASEKDVSIEHSQTKQESIISDETELQASSEIHNNDEFMNDPMPPILKLEKDEDDLEGGNFKVNSTNPFRSSSQSNSRKPTIPDLKNYFTYEMNMFQHYETTDGRIERPPSRAYSKSRSEKLAPLNISKINAVNNNIMKRSPDLNAVFLQRNRLNNQKMVDALKAFNDKMNVTYGVLNKIYAVREKRIIDLERRKKTLDGKNRLMHELHTSYEIEKSKLKNSETDEDIKLNLKTIHNEWESVIQESLIAQLTLKTATVVRKSPSNSDEERLTKLQKIGELLRLDKVKAKMFKAMDDGKNEKEEMTRKMHISFIEKIIAEKSKNREN